MSDPTSRLNLIQRAMQRGALAREAPQADPAPVPEPVEIQPIREPGRSDHAVRPAALAPQPVERAAPSRVPDQFLATAAPSIRPELAETPRLGKAQPVRLDIEKLTNSRISSPDNTHSVTYNEFRSLKRKLIPMTVDPETRGMTRNMVMVTSALPGEGKTFTAMNLAIALAAEPNLNVILVDADVVQSSIASYFQASDHDGLLELLTGKRHHLDEVLHPCADLPRLHVLFAGARDDATPELLASRGMTELCADLATRFPQSIVLFDAPPVLAGSEPAAMASHVHHVLMVVAAGRSGRDQVEAALTEVSRCPSISMVFNQSPEWERPLNDMYSRPYSYGPPKSEETSV
jgi:protein-tyrosine kinase